MSLIQIYLTTCTQHNTVIFNLNESFETPIKNRSLLEMNLPIAKKNKIVK